MFVRGGGGALKHFFGFAWETSWIIIPYASVSAENLCLISIRHVFGRVAKFGHNVSGSKVLTRGRTLKLTFRGHHIPTYFDASWREKYNGVFFPRYLCWIASYKRSTFPWKAVIFYLSPTGSLLLIRFTSTPSASLLELSAGFLLPFSDLP